MGIIKLKKNGAYYELKKNLAKINCKENELKT